MTWIVEHFGVGFMVLMIVWALIDPTPRDDSVRRGKRYRQKRYWR